MSHADNWGSWKFKSSCASAIESLCTTDEEFCPPTITAIIDTINQTQPCSITCPIGWEEVDDVLCDFSFDELETKKEKSSPAQKPEKIIEPEDSRDLSAVAEELLKKLREESQDIPSSIPVLSSLSQEKLCLVLKLIWPQLKDLTEKMTFINALSSIQSARNAFCSEILKPWMETNFDEALSAVKEVIFSLYLSIVSPILSLAQGEDSLFVRHNERFLQVFSCFEEEQKEDFVRKLLLSIGSQLGAHHLPLLLVVTECSSLPEHNLKNLLDCIAAVIQSFSSDRTMGKLLSTVVEKQLGETSSCELLDKAIGVCGCYKGMMRMKLLSSLNHYKAVTK